MTSNRCKIHGIRLILDPPNDPYCEDCEGGELAQLEADRDRAEEIKRDLAEDERRDELRDYQSPDQFASQQHRRDTMGEGDQP